MYYTQEEIEETIENKFSEAEKKFGKQFKLALIELTGLIKMCYTSELKKPSEAILIPLSEWNNHYKYPSVGALRQYYFKRESNGFDKVVEYGGADGGRILINADKYFTWQASRKKAR